jgi:hypothetical protein
MCTVTVVPTRHGFRLACNRDELDTRPAALRPRWRTIASRTAVFPVDPQSGGTWIGVNAAGLALALLNRNDRSGVQQSGHAKRSRGLIVPSLLGHTTAAGVLEALGSLEQASYEPFHLCAVEPGEVGFVSSDGCELSIERHPLVRPVLFTSSGLGDSLVIAPRSKLFDDLVLANECSWLEGQARFHTHQWPERPHLSVLMRRDGARTVSRSVIDVAGTTIRFRYRPIPDIQSVPGTSVR